jgi:hypothetical protein
MGKRKQPPSENTVRIPWYIDDRMYCLSANAQNIVRVLARCYDGKTKTSSPSYETIMRGTGIKKRQTVGKCIKEINDKEIMVVAFSKGRTPHTYRWPAPPVGYIPPAQLYRPGVQLKKGDKPKRAVNCTLSRHPTVPPRGTPSNMYSTDKKSSTVPPVSASSPAACGPPGPSGPDTSRAHKIVDMFNRICFAHPTARKADGTLGRIIEAIKQNPELKRLDKWEELFNLAKDNTLANGRDRVTGNGLPRNLGWIITHRDTIFNGSTKLQPIGEVIT